MTVRWQGQLLCFTLFYCLVYISDGLSDTASWHDNNWDHNQDHGQGVSSYATPGPLPLPVHTSTPCSVPLSRLPLTWNNETWKWEETSSQGDEAEAPGPQMAQALDAGALPTGTRPKKPNSIVADVKGRLTRRRNPKYYD
jgi:hypothetical protein